MLTAISSGILLGVIISFLIGPVFFGLIQTSIRQGLGRAMIYEIGTILSDTIILFLCYLGLAKILAGDSYRHAIGIAGAILLFSMGLYTLLKKKKKTNQGVEPIVEKSHPLALILKSFLLNTINPSVILFWILQVSLAVSNFGGKKGIIIAHFISVLSTMILFDFLKAFGANKIKKYLRPRTFDLIAKIEGILLIIFSVVILVRTFWPTEA
jgi:threonine/homoserine/homoserine lactone efflux protein